MPVHVHPVRDEREGLLAFLAQQRYVLRLAAHGLTDEQARIRPTASALSIGGLLKHAARTERGWMARVLQRRPPDQSGDFELTSDETLDSVLAEYGQVGRETEEVVAGIPDLGHPVPVPRAAPWFPVEVEAWSLRWVLLHLIQETARHAGHADIIREHLDGAKAFELMAAAESWPDSRGIQPWGREEG
ncbi:DinB family protein [Amycolatopsis dongchuanensis]|uniref:DinB family protein n=1 Tax=Amycolatopsis dongchuanensis TaxID=1070866 RepID=A0ABP8VKZ9_9PSEU